MDNTEKFTVEFEDGEVKEAELLTIAIIDDKDYAVYAVRNDDETVSIMASYIVKDETGTDVLKDIDSEEDKIKISSFVLEVAGEA